MTTQVGPVKFDSESRAKITLTVKTDFDPAGATVELWVAGEWHPCTWTGAATTTTEGQWKRPAVTDVYFAGSAAAAADAADIVLTGVSRFTQSRVTSGGDQIVAASTPIDVT